MSTLFTIGHSVHPIDRFVDLLTAHDIAVVCDVRSLPHSRRQPQFNREPLRAALSAHAIEYLFAGDVLGGRPSDPALHENGRVSYRRIAASTAFQAAIAGLRQSSASASIAVMCAEKEPLDCHRTILIARALRAPDLTIEHILADGALEPHQRTEERLLKKMRVASRDLLIDRPAAVERAYDALGDRISPAIEG